MSYASEDRDEARLLAAYLEAEGYSVWWDTSLLSGENFRKTIMTELGRARAAIVIWTEHSIASDWVQSEAGRAHADRKLIPVKAKGLVYRDIPPPFDNMHIEDVAAREKILAAVVAELAKPDIQISALGRVSKKTRFELLSWFGIAGAVISLSANLQGVLTLARWARYVSESWVSILKYVWGHILFFLPKMYADDALFVTFVAFAVINMSLCSRQSPQTAASRKTSVSIAVAALLIVTIFALGFMTIAGHSSEGDGYYIRYVVVKFLDVRTYVDEIGGLTGLLIAVVYGISVLFILPLLIVIACYSLVKFVFSFRLSVVALSGRLWRITVGVGLVIGVNYFAVWLEHQPWFAQFPQ